MSEDYDNLVGAVSDRSSLAGLRASSVMDENPDDAAESYRLSQSTGVPPTIINADLPGFQQKYKGALAGDIIRNNPMISNYIQSHPLAAQISNDDYGKLDELSGTLKALDSIRKFTIPGLGEVRKFTAPWLGDLKESPLKRFTEGGPIGQDWEDFSKQHPYLDFALNTLVPSLRHSSDMAELALRGVTGTAETAADIIKDTATKIGGEPFGVEAGALFEAEAAGLTGRAHIPVEVARDFQFKRNQAAVKSLADAVKQAQTTNTYGRSAELQRDNFIRDQHFPDGGNIDIAGRAASELYGEKEPIPDDNQLGWVPNIAEQLQVARDTGADVSIPIEHFVSHMTPELLKALEDDIRAVPEGITNREAQEFIPPPTSVVDEVVPQLRAANGMEPLFSIGDRKLELRRIASKEHLEEAENNARLNWEIGQPGARWNQLSKEEQQAAITREVNRLKSAWSGFHDFDMLNENGQSVGTVNLSEQKGGKELYVEMIGGLGEYYNPNNFGPGLMRSILRQIKTEFPNAEYLTGHRISGARERAGVEMTAPMPKIKLDEYLHDPIDTHRKLFDILSGSWAQAYPGMDINIKPSELFTEHEREITSAVQREIDKMAPKGIIAAPVAGIRRADAQPRGYYQQFHEGRSVIAWALGGEDQLGTARHEILHAVRDRFTPEEWDALEKASVDENWKGKFDIEERYSGLSESGKLEESIADAFKQWRLESVLRKGQPTTAIDKIFQKLQDFLDAVRDQLRRILGKEPTWEDLFQKIETGEIRDRPVFGAERGPKFEEPPSKTFTTAKGSTYQIHEDGTTTRNKAARPDPGHEGDFGLKPRSAKTIYLEKPEHAASLSAAGLRGLGPKGARVVIKDGKASLATWNDKEGKWGISPESRDIPFTTEPKVGRAPLELWNPATDIPQGYEGYSKMHAGNAITEMKEAKPQAQPQAKPTQPAPQPTQARPAQPPLVPSAPFGEPELAPQSPYRAPKDVGMTVTQHNNYMKAVRGVQEMDLERSAKRILREQTKRQSDEWKRQSEAMRADVVRDINARPDILADTFLGAAMKPADRLDWSKLTPDQRKALPDRYTVRKGGLDPDAVATQLGFQSGDQMIQAIAKIVETRDASGLGRERYMRQLVNAEIQRRMETEHGLLAKNILDEVKDQILSENQLDLMHEETKSLALRAGVDYGTLTLGDIVSGIKEKFDQLPMHAIDSKKFERETAKNGRAAEMSLLANKPADAFVAKQAQLHNTIYAKFAKEIEKDRKKLDKAAKPYAKVDPPRNIPGEYLNHIQDLLDSAGYKVGRSLENIEENLTRRGKTLEEFANENLVDSNGLKQFMIPDFILDGKIKLVDNMTAWEFRGFKRAVDTLIKNAKDEGKIIHEGRVENLNAALDEMKDHVREFDIKDQKHNIKSGLLARGLEMPRSFLAGITGVETFLNRLGRRDPKSVFNRLINYPLARAANYEAKLERQFSEPLRELGELEGKKKLTAIPPMIDPATGKQFLSFSRDNVQVMIHNAGNKSNWEKFAKGYKADPQTLLTWLEDNSTPDMWKRAQDMGSNVFKEVIALADQQREHMNGITIDKIPLRPFTNKHGTFEGWYHPLIPDADYAGEGKAKGLAWDDTDYGHIDTNDGYTIKRTGALYPVSLNTDMIGVKLKQMIHDIAFKDTILQVDKIFRDNELSNLITARFGANYNSKNMLRPYLKSIAGEVSTASKATRDLDRVIETTRQNTIGTYIGFNIGTALKHGPTALGFSARQVGTVNFIPVFAKMSLESIFGEPMAGMLNTVGLTNWADAVRDLYSRSPDLTKSNHEFAMQWSEELQRREKHWQDTFVGAQKMMQGEGSFRQKMLQWGSWLVAKSDMLSAKPTWIAGYRKAINDLEMTHGDAIGYADAQVRRAHGSTAITSQPALVREGGAMHSTYVSLYGFFGMRMQHLIELGHDANDAYGFMKGGEYSKAAGKIPGMLADTLTYALWPIVVEEAVAALTTEDHRSLGMHIAAALTMGMAASVPYIREIVHGLVTDDDATLGLLGSAVKDFVHGGKAPWKSDAWSRARAGKTVGDIMKMAGIATGASPMALGSAVHFGIDLVNNVAHPRGFLDWYRGIERGRVKPREVK